MGERVKYRGSALLLAARDEGREEMTTTLKILAFITFFSGAPATAAPWHISGAVWPYGSKLHVNLNVTDESGSGVAGLRAPNFRVSYGLHIHDVHKANVRDDLFVGTAAGNYTLVLATADKLGATNRTLLAPRLPDFTQRGIALLPVTR